MDGWQLIIPLAINELLICAPLTCKLTQVSSPSPHLDSRMWSLPSSENPLFGSDPLLTALGCRDGGQRGGGSEEMWGGGVQARLEPFEERTHVSFAILLRFKKKM